MSRHALKNPVVIIRKKFYQISVQFHLLKMSFLLKVTYIQIINFYFEYYVRHKKVLKYCYAINIFSIKPSFTQC